MGPNPLTRLERIFDRLAAIVDRLTCGGIIIETGTEPYRLASTRAARVQG
ncbi:hypothetical protein GCM10010358_82300 [Streptomyces minutiscleroticus]|uniref:Uncharacterized protein n=1 Tax=Streptomyces minutiscleroticus TaxID=68238 RepID=A0A918P4J5_9ACTN|nr:hypothetical protein GCM10010358_82300 [Streptomyces minutiscleroticus]